MTLNNAKGLFRPAKSRGGWGSPDPLRFWDFEACFTCFSGKVTDVVDTLNNFEHNLVQCFICFRAVI